MNENVTSLVQGLLDVIDRKDWFNANGNQRELALLDARSADDAIEALEDKLESLEYDSEDYYTIDKDTFESESRKALRSYFYTDDGDITEEFENFEGVMPEIIDELQELFVAMMVKNNDK